MDMPGRRKMHKDPIPRLGGVGIFVGLLPLFLFSGFDRRSVSFLAGCIIIFFVGLLDDIKGVRWRLKILGTFVASSVIIFYGGARVEHLGTIIGSGNLDLGIFSIPFTYFCILGIVNAINFIDGLNGLAAGISLMAFATFAVFASLAGDASSLYICLAFMGGLAGFLKDNYLHERIFLGDSGSMLLGFSLVFLSIVLFQDNARFEPMIPVLVLALPIFDTIRVAISRIVRGKSPFMADKTHLHHILIRGGVYKRKVVPLLWVLNVVFCLSAIFARSAQGWLLLVVFANLTVTISVFIVAFLSRERRVSKRREFAVEKSVKEKPKIIVGEVFEDDYFNVRNKTWRQ